MLPTSVRLATLLLLFSLSAAGFLYAQPFDLPAPNVPPDVRGVNPAFRVSFGTHEWGDFNGDGEMDFVIMGRLPATNRGTFPLYADVLRSSPSLPEPGSPPVFDYFSARSLTAMWLGDAAWGDVDNDGDLDLITQGATSTGGDFAPRTILYRTTGNQISVWDDSSLPGLYAGSLDWGDYDNDGDLDLAVSGLRSDGGHLATVFRNEGDGQLLDVSPGLVQLAFGPMAWIDVDSDGDLDLFSAGAEREGPLHAILYLNEGDGRLVRSGQNLAGVSHSSADWGDYDGDGDPDLLITGLELSPLLGSGVTRLYRNNGGQLAEVPADLPGVYFGDAGWVDYDGDGDLDVLITGRSEPFGARVTVACVQDVVGVFSCGQIQLVGLGAQPVPGLAYCTIGWADYDHDSDLDLFVTGDAGSGQATTFYRNAGTGRNTPPEPPSGLQAVVSGPGVEFTWLAAVDPDGSSSGLMYSVRVGSAPAAVDVLSPHADPATGARYVLDEGNAGQRLSMRLTLPGPGTYYWSVQAIDNSFAGSSFASEQTFTVGG